ncbi:MAG TPA: hypothetical protein VMF90_11380 [Rhizobiaceae bacterium]|nr:hypothetical protein [Rhizobiaceae bacterium]
MSTLDLMEPADFHVNGDGELQTFSRLEDAIRAAMEIAPTRREKGAFIETRSGNRYGWDAIAQLYSEL